MSDLDHSSYSLATQVCNLCFQYDFQKLLGFWNPLFIKLLLFFILSTQDLLSLPQSTCQKKGKKLNVSTWLHFHFSFHKGLEFYHLIFPISQGTWALPPFFFVGQENQAWTDELSLFLQPSQTREFFPAVPGAFPPSPSHLYLLNSMLYLYIFHLTTKIRAGDVSLYYHFGIFCYLHGKSFFYFLRLLYRRLLQWSVFIYFSLQIR